ncbi:succinylglutamate desuccinylase/aspartoacylase family protein [Halorubrum sp. BOL3-1]|uniref:succinylglutamate desuccinylase/aspartoacylase family protein n=1 Tax=Halorubrum sp. BOL3-1 TaxID=2497325 RepID=UPI00100508A3|nr:succinylglutamate desuccinylase/aspartoacylase family protein [Halorubrum sp. BOL3-1]QAU11910.1 succinylglutamate desuccinylase/aspartoacylase family protein [Halorubrum sp. BOL3-1]
MTDREPEAFTFDGGRVEPGETEEFRYPVSETYLGDPVRIPVTIINGSRPGPTVFLSAAIHGDELNGIEVVREVSQEWDHSDVCGTLVCLPVLNVQGFVTQERYLPIYERDLNRAFPGKQDSTGSNRIAYRIYRNFIEPCDLGLDFHTSTRGRTNMFHVRADMDDEGAARLARAFGTNLIMAGEGSSGMLRREATDGGVPTVTLEMGEAHRFERELIDHALKGVRSVFAEYGIYQQETVRWPGWRTVIDDWSEKTWLRADSGGIVEMYYEQGELVHEDEVICRIANPFKSDATVVEAPFTGILVGVLENPVVYPGNPLCHFAKIDTMQEDIIESQTDRLHE